MNKKEKVFVIAFIVFCIIGIIAMCYRAEQIDTKKELSNAKIDNIIR